MRIPGAFVMSSKSWAFASSPGRPGSAIASFTSSSGMWIIDLPMALASATALLNSEVGSRSWSIGWTRVCAALSAVCISASDNGACPFKILCWSIFLTAVTAAGLYVPKFGSSYRDRNLAVYCGRRSLIGLPSCTSAGAYPLPTVSCMDAANRATRLAPGMGLSPVPLFVPPVVESVPESRRPDENPPAEPPAPELPAMPVGVSRPEGVEPLRLAPARSGAIPVFEPLTRPVLARISSNALMET